jgi:hypothetical protein
MQLNELQKRRDAEMAKHPLRAEMTFVDGFLVLGAGTRLAKIGEPLDETRLAALLTAAHGRQFSASSRVHLRRALDARRDDDLPLAHVHIALSGPAKLSNPKEDAQRLFMADELMKAGVEPSTIVTGLGLGPPSLHKALRKYSADQPRVPAGNRDGGQWMREDGSGDGAAASSTKPKAAHPRTQRLPTVHDVPKDAVTVKAGDGTSFLAPPDANFPEIYAAAKANGKNSDATKAAIGQFGTYDFQRKDGNFYTAYIDASNYAVGVYMAGAGYGYTTMLVYGAIYAMTHSSNWESESHIVWWTKGWNDATNGTGPFSPSAP